MMCTTVLHGGVCHRTSTPHKSGIKMKEKRCGAEAHTLVSWMSALRTITGCLRPTKVDQLPVLAEIALPGLRR